MNARRLGWTAMLALAGTMSLTPPSAASSAAPAGPPGGDATVRTAAGLEALVPELADHPYRLEPGSRPYRHRFSLSPAYGTLGSERLYSLRLGYNPDSWMGYEVALGHNPGHSTHAVLHTLSLIVRRPFPGRVQPYLSGGYGMIMVYPGHSVNADPVTKNTLAYGGGVEFYLRGDLALRGELRRASVIGSQRDREGLVAYDYTQGTVGLAFYRSVRP